eukprot:4576151-Prymnesium_polylepis.1
MRDRAAPIHLCSGSVTPAREQQCPAKPSAGDVAAVGAFESRVDSTIGAKIGVPRIILRSVQHRRSQCDLIEGCDRTSSVIGRAQLSGREDDASQLSAEGTRIRGFTVGQLCVHLEKAFAPVHSARRVKLCKVVGRLRHLVRLCERRAPLARLGGNQRLKSLVRFYVLARIDLQASLLQDQPSKHDRLEPHRGVIDRLHAAKCLPRLHAALTLVLVRAACERPKLPGAKPLFFRGGHARCRTDGLAADAQRDRRLHPSEWMIDRQLQDAVIPRERRRGRRVAQRSESGSNVVLKVRFSIRDYPRRWCRLLQCPTERVQDVVLQQSPRWHARTRAGVRQIVNHNAVPDGPLQKRELEQHSEAAAWARHFFRIATSSGRAGTTLVSRRAHLMVKDGLQHVEDRSRHHRILGERRAHIEERHSCVMALGLQQRQRGKDDPILGTALAAAVVVSIATSKHQLVCAPQERHELRLPHISILLHERPRKFKREGQAAAQLHHIESCLGHCRALRHGDTTAAQQQL